MCQCMGFEAADIQPPVSSHSTRLHRQCVQPQTQHVSTAPALPYFWVVLSWLNLVQKLPVTVHDILGPCVMPGRVQPKLGVADFQPFYGFYGHSLPCLGVDTLFCRQGPGNGHGVAVVGCGWGGHKLFLPSMDPYRTVFTNTVRPAQPFCSRLLLALRTHHPAWNGCKPCPVHAYQWPANA